jgi:hypothetical protein
MIPLDCAGSNAENSSQALFPGLYSTERVWLDSRIGDAFFSLDLQ